MAMKILALDGIGDAKLCKLMGVLLQSVPGVEYANIDYLSQKLTLQISARDTTRVIKRVTELLEENMPGVTIRYVDAETGEITDKPKITAYDKKNGSLNIDLNKAIGTKPSADAADNKADKSPKKSRVKKGAEERAEGGTIKPESAVGLSMGADLSQKSDGPAPQASMERNSQIRAMVMREKGEFAEEPKDEVGFENYDPDAPQPPVVIKPREDKPKPESASAEAAEETAKDEAVKDEITETPAKDEAAEEAAKDEITEDEAAKEEAAEETAKDEETEKTAAAEETEKASAAPKTEEQPTKQKSLSEMIDEYIESETAAEITETEEEPPEEEPEEIAEEEEPEKTEEPEEEEKTEEEPEEEIEDGHVGTGLFKQLFPNLSNEDLRHWAAVFLSCVCLLFSLVMNYSSPGAIVLQGAAFIVLSVFAIISDPGEDNELITLVNSCIVVLASALMFFTGARIDAIITLLAYNLAFFAICKLFYRHKESINSIINITPPTLTIVSDGNKTENIAFSANITNSPVLIHPGQTIPFDGYISEGSTTIDSSLITGNKQPVAAEIGQRVNCGDINLTGEIQITVISLQENSVVSRVRKMVIGDDAERLRYVRAAGRMSVIAILGLTAALAALCAYYIISGNSSQCLYIAPLIVTLMAPCGLKQTSALIQKSSLCRALRLGIVIPNSVKMSELADIKTVACEYQGIMTNGECEITEIVTEPDISAEDLIKTAAYAEYGNRELPVARAIVDYYRRKYTAEVIASHIAFCDVAPGGVSAMAEARMISVGDIGFMRHQNIDVAEDMSNRHCLYVARYATCIGRIYYTEPYSSGAKSFSPRLKSIGIERTALITESSQRDSQIENSALHFDEIYAEYSIRNTPNAVGRIIRRSNSSNEVAYIGNFASAEYMTQMCPSVITGEDAIVQGLYIGHALVPSSEPTKIFKAFSIARSARASVRIITALSLLLRAALLILGVLCELPLWAAGVMITAMMLADVIYAVFSEKQN